MTENISRRGFFKRAITTGIAFSSAGLVRADNDLNNGYDAKGLPTVILGKTGVRIPRIALGLGSRFCTIKDEDESLAMLEFALDNGFYYWDTASIYASADNKIISEARIGRAVKGNRDRIFLSTKVTARDPDEAMRSIELSLKRLQTDHLDMLKIHDIHSAEDNQEILKKGGLRDILYKMKEEGVTRFIGFSGHGSAEALREMAESGDFDSMLIAMNHWAGNTQKREEWAIPCALDKGMGVMLMKAVRPKETVQGVKIPDLVRFALSLDGPHGVTVGMDSIEVVKSNIGILKSFTPMSDKEKQAMTIALSPFFHHQNLPWMDKDYCDGHWV